jgi:hypothetical protein
VTFGTGHDDHPRTPSDTCPGTGDDLLSIAAGQRNEVSPAPLNGATSVGLLDTVVSGRIPPEFATRNRARPTDIRFTDTQPIAACAAASRATDTGYVLRRQRRHLVVGTLLQCTPRALTNRQAKTWVTRQVTTTKTSLLPRKLFDEADPDGGWHTSSSLLVEQYALYRHPDGWQLLGAVIRVPRPRIVTDDDAKAWAADALKRLAPLSWALGLVTQSTTTWYATP